MTKQYKNCSLSESVNDSEQSKTSPQTQKNLDLTRLISTFHSAKFEQQPPISLNSINNEINTAIRTANLGKLEDILINYSQFLYNKVLEEIIGCNESIFAIHIAAKYGLKKAFSALLKNKADINSETASGKTPLDFARESSSESIVEFIKGHFCRISPDELNEVLMKRNRELAYVERVNANLKKNLLTLTTNYSILNQIILQIQEDKKSQIYNSNLIEKLQDYIEKSDSERSKTLSELRNNPNLTPFSPANFEQQPSELLESVKNEINMKIELEIIRQNKSKLENYLINYSHFLYNKVLDGIIDCDEPIFAIHIAAKYGLKKAFSALLENKADMYSETTSGQTPLDFAKESYNKSMAEFIKGYFCRTSSKKNTSENIANLEQTKVRYKVLLDQDKDFLQSQKTKTTLEKQLLYLIKDCSSQAQITQKLLLEIKEDKKNLILQPSYYSILEQQEQNSDQEEQLKKRKDTETEIQDPKNGEIINEDEGNIPKKPRIGEASNHKHYEFCVPPYEFCR